MNIVDATFYVPEHIAQGLSNGTYERVGGVVREIGSKQVVAWLREIYEKSEPVLSNVLASSSVSALSNNLNLAVSSVNIVSSTLNLAVSTMGFIVVKKRLDRIEKQLRQAQEEIRSIDFKIDLSFYANFRTGLGLANNAFTMTDPENRRKFASDTISHFLEAEDHYAELTDVEIGKGSLLAGEYLSTLCLAYVTEVRCYLELEELDTARRRLQVGAAELRLLFEKNINRLLTSNPAAYLHPSIKEQVGLKRLTKVFQWLEPGLDESEVFEMQRENLFNLAQKPEKWINSLPPAIHIPAAQNNFAKQTKEVLGALPLVSIISRLKPGSQEAVMQSPEKEICGRLPATMELMESMVEDDNRLAMYESEVEMIQRLGMSFQEWRQLTPPSTAQGNEMDLICITVA